MYQMPPPPPRRRKLNIFQIILILAAVAFAGWYVFTTLAPVTAQEAIVQTAELGQLYVGDCLIVRDEKPYDAEGVTNIIYEVEEGSLVGDNKRICKVYAAGYSNKEMQTLQDHRDLLRDYQLQLLAAETTYDAKQARLDNEVLDRAKAFRQMLNGARGNMRNQEKAIANAMDERQQYVKDRYTEEPRLTRLYSNEKAQQQRIDSWLKEYVSTGESIVSFYTDGYEYSLTAANYDQYTPAQVRSLYEGKIPELSSVQKGRTTIYRTISNNGWYVLFLVENGAAWNPMEGQTYLLKLERKDDAPVQATVVSYTRSGGELLVRLRIDSDVKPVMYTRSCKGELGDSVDTLAVPSRAMYNFEGTMGVVAKDGSHRLFIPVNVVMEKDGYTYITPQQQGALKEGTRVVLF